MSDSNIIQFPVGRIPKRTRNLAEKEDAVIPFPTSKMIPPSSTNGSNELTESLLKEADDTPDRRNRDFKYLSLDWNNSILSTLATSEELYETLRTIDGYIDGSLMNDQDKKESAENIRRLVEEACEYGALVNSMLGDSGIDFSLGDCPTDYLNKYDADEELPDDLTTFYNGTNDVKNNPHYTSRYTPKSTKG